MKFLVNPEKAVLFFCNGVVIDLLHFIRSNDEYLIVFDLTSTEVYKRTITEDQKVKTSKIPVFPQEWQNQFGLPFEEHRKSLQVNIFDGYAVYGFKDGSVTPQEAVDNATAQSGGGDQE